MNGDRVTARVAAQFRKDVSDPIVGILIRNRLGIDVFGTNTAWKPASWANSTRATGSKSSSASSACWPSRNTR